MAVFVCKVCGYTAEGRCKPKKCPQCGSENSFEKAQEKK